MTQGVRIRRARLRLKLTQIGLADLIGVHQSSVAYWESDKTRPRAGTLLQLAETLDVAPEWLEFGSSFGSGEAQIPVVGALLQGAVQRPTSNSQAGNGESISTHLDGSRLVSVRIADDSLAPAYQQGDFVLGPLLSGQDMSQARGRDSVVQYWDGRFTLKRLDLDEIGNGSGSDLGSGGLHGEWREIAWCMPVEWVRRDVPGTPAVTNSQDSANPVQNRALEVVT